jgi:hypothetical protein
LALGRLSALRDLEIIMQRALNEDDGFCDVEDGDLAKLVSGLRELCAFGLIVKSPLTVAALQEHWHAVQVLG